MLFVTSSQLFLYNRIIQKSFYKKNGDIADGSRKAKRIHADVFLNMSIKINLEMIQLVILMMKFHYKCVNV